MAWSDVSFPAAKQLDQQVVNGILEAFSESNVRLGNVGINLESGPSFDVSGEGAQQNQSLKNVFAAKGTIIRVLNARGTLRGRSVSISFRRDPAQPTDSVSVHLTDLAPIGEAPDVVAEVNQFVQRIKTNLAALDTRGGLGKILGEDTRLFYERREANLQRVEALGLSMLDQFGREITATRTQLETEYRARLTQLEGDYQALHERLRKEMDDRAKTLEQREKALQERIADVDDRDVRHARREIRKDQKKELEARSARFELTPGTVKLRQPIANVCKVLLWFFGVGAVLFTGLNIYLAVWGGNVSTTIWVALGVKQAALTAGLISTAVFYIRWNNRWFEQHSTEEFRLKRLGLDLDRASWLVETTLEWKEEKGTEIPNVLVERLSAGLFEADRPKETALHPADQLASALLGASAEATLEMPGGSKLRIDRKGLRELRKEPNN